MSCEHCWMLMSQGFYDEKLRTQQYEIYYCQKCLAQVTVEFPEGQRKVTDFSDCTMEVLAG